MQKKNDFCLVLKIESPLLPIKGQVLQVVFSAYDFVIIKHDLDGHGRMIPF